MSDVEVNPDLRDDDPGRDDPGRSSPTRADTVRDDSGPATAVPLRRNGPFQLLWTGAAFSILGLEVAALVFPLVVLMVTGSPGAAGAVASVEMIAGLVLGLPAGELVDRHDRRVVLILVEVGRAVGAASVVVALALDALTLPHLLVVAVVMGSMRPFSATARMLMIRALVPSEQLTAALTQEEARVSGASLVGPPLGGALFAVAAVVPWLVTTVSSLVAGVCMALVRVPPAAKPEPAPTADGGSIARRIATGLSVLWNQATLRRTTLFTAAMNAASAPLVLVTAVYLTAQGVSSEQIGIATAGLAVGGLLGTLLIGRLNRLAPGVLMLGQAAFLTVLLCVLALPLGPWGAGSALFLSMLGVPTMRVLVDIVLFRQVPDAQRGRVASAAMTLWGASSALGTLVVGLLLDVAPVWVVLVGLAGALALVFAFGLLNPVFRRTAWPAETA